jgi:hypothetical protein
MPALANCGLYQLRFEGQPVTTRPLRFAVVDFAALRP